MLKSPKPKKDRHKALENSTILQHCKEKLIDCTTIQQVVLFKSLNPYTKNIKQSHTPELIQKLCLKIMLPLA